jgi:hypothetical protein
MKIKQIEELIEEVRLEQSAYDIGHDGVVAVKWALDSLKEKLRAASEQTKSAEKSRRSRPRR